MINYTVEKSKRKTMTVVVKGDGSVVVRAPRSMPDWQIERFVDAKQDWIQKAVAEIKGRRSRFSPFSLEEGGTMLYFGRALKVEVAQGKRAYISGDFLFIPDTDNRRDCVIRLMKAELLKYMKLRVDYYSRLMQVTPTALKIGSAKTRWGSCSAKNSLNFSYRLCMCPDCVIDYVIVHELAHIKHHDHSASFWRYVAEFMPQYKKMKNWLRDNSFIMEIL